AEFTIYTPGSDAGVPVSVLGSFDPPPVDSRSGEAFTERVDSSVASLLSLIGVDADPLQDGEHIFLAKVIGDAWAGGRSLTLADLIGALQSPPFEKLGVMEVDSFFPPKKRNALAMRLNGLVASPGFAVWAQGEPLDVDRLFFGDDGKPRVSVFSIAHLDDAERMFFVTKLLGEIIAWMRRQPGTGSLRALLYMDEIFGYLPPTANPASKNLFLTLLKQARAFGLGIVLSTQNPVDMDYKALSNCGTWFVGRLQTERDKMRLLDGLEGASQNAEFDRSRMDKILSGVGKRTFLLHNVHDSEPVLMTTRWVMSYLAGPMTRKQISRLMEARKAAAIPADQAIENITTATEAMVQAPAPVAASGPPVLPGTIPQVFVASSGGTVDTYLPMMLARAEVPYSRSSIKLNHRANFTFLAEVATNAPDWHSADVLDERPQSDAQPAEGATFAELPAALANPSTFEKADDSLKRWLQSERPLTLFKSKTLKTVSDPGEDERSFRIRLTQIAREARDEKKNVLRERYQKKLDALHKRMRTAESAVDREASQASQRKMDTVINIGTSILGAFLGGSRRSSVSRIGTAARSAGRARKESADVARAEARLDDLKARYADLDAELTRELEDLDLSFTPETEGLETIEVKAKQSEMHITELALAWVPFSKDAEGRLARA
ncbi:MAG: ATP-binding protein, partial [Bacteroidetes bacterium]|nr:ATP-binding protein [Bacteroidota bacterium]